MSRVTSRSGLALLATVMFSVAFADEADMAVGIGDEQLADIGRRWASALSESDAAALRATLDVEGLALRSVASFSDNEAMQAEFVRGFAAGADRLVQSWIGDVEAAEGQARFLKVHSFDGMRGPLVRYDLGEQGYNYVLLIVAARDNAAPRVVDLFVASNGQRLSETLGAVTQLIAAPSESLIGKVFGVTTVDQELAAMFRTIGQLRLRGRIDEAYSMLVQLPDEIRNHRVMLNISLALSGQLGEDVYREELARLARYHGDDPTAAFALIDYYIYNGEYDSGMKALLGMERAFGEDGAIAELKAGIAMLDGDLARARGYAQTGIDLEPSNESPRWTLLTVLMTAGQYAEGVRVIEGLERDFDYEFEAANFAEQELFAGFVDSPEYEAWMAKRGTPVR